MNKFQLVMYLKEQDNILDAVICALNWLLYRSEPGIPGGLKKEVFLLVDAVIESIEELGIMVGEAKTYFRKFSGKKRSHIKKIVANIDEKGHEADKAEDIPRLKSLLTARDYHLFQLAKRLVFKVLAHGRHSIISPSAPKCLESRRCEMSHTT